MKELRDKINELLDKCVSEEMLRKAYEYILFLYIHIFGKDIE